MIRKFHEAKVDEAKGVRSTVRLWGTGNAFREFLHVDDVATAACDLMMGPFTGLYNVGSGEELTIRELADMIKGVVGYTGIVEWDSTRPDGTPRKLLDSSRVRSTGWVPRIPLERGIRATYEWYRNHSSADSRAVS
jgi:GDP-L-fucose synthase